MNNAQRLQAAYSDKLAELERQIQELQAMHAEAAARTPSNWGHVGDLDGVVSELKDPTDRYMKRGEYA